MPDIIIFHQYQNFNLNPPEDPLNFEKFTLRCQSLIKFDHILEDFDKFPLKSTFISDDIVSIHLPCLSLIGDILMTARPL